MGSALPEDAWNRYMHVRGELAAVDAKIQALNVEGLIHRGMVDEQEVASVRDLLSEQASTSAAFGESAQTLGNALR